MSRFLIIALSALLASCALRSSPPAPGHGGICAARPDSQKCQEGTIGAANK